MIATKQIRKNEKLDSGHNIENTVTYMNGDTKLISLIGKALDRENGCKLMPP